MYFHYFIIILSPLGKGGVLHLNKLQSPSPKGALCQVWLKLFQWFFRRRFWNFVNVISLFRNYHLLEKGGTFYLNKLESPSPNDALCQVWLKLVLWFWRRWKCEKFSTTTTTMTATTTMTEYVQILIRKTRLSLRLRWTKKKSLSQFWELMALYLLNLESSSPKDAPSLVVIGPVETTIFKYRQFLFVISLFSPLGKGRNPLFE